MPLGRQDDDHKKRILHASVSVSCKVIILCRYFMRRIKTKRQNVSNFAPPRKSHHCYWGLASSGQRKRGKVKDGLCAYPVWAPTSLHKRTMWRSFFPLSNIYFALNQFLKAGMQIRWGLSRELHTHHSARL